ncbi:hypothetical protein CW735_05025 [Alteromonas sp. MB-3u-76]|uniref:FkbM family methyltransferase n=1 Tax=Alteromonas sp. MB-3u-76 TaxID=2058133 RepID=UPI000C30C018|nr:FkbM family methyltransferase [Alteromonas sp. MB-3u-76]AUC87641.1 hypothetical protein CW735_05025 [Alteromonas sp. MB-3u-76]
MGNLQSLIESTTTWQTPEDILAEYDTFAVFGTGGCGLEVTKVLTQYGKKISFYIDNDINKHDTNFLDRPVLSIEQAAEKSIFTLIASYRARDIAAQLSEYKMAYADFSFCVDWDRWKDHFNPRVFDAKSALATGLKFFSDEDLTMYLSCIRYRQTLNPLDLQANNIEHYHHPRVSPEAKDVFIDGGSWQGDTLELLKQNIGDIDVHCFEPDSENYDILSALIDQKEYSQATANMLALWSKKHTLKFIASTDTVHTMQARVMDESDAVSEVLVPADSLDNYVASKSIIPSFFKLDIEGAELEAIEGARETLTHNKPKIALSAYHEPNDIWQIPELVNEINPFYQFYFCHHSQHLFDSVVYGR